MARTIKDIFSVKVEGVGPMLQHKYIGKDNIGAVKKLPDADQAEHYLYRVNGAGSNIGIPGVHFLGSIVAAFKDSAGRKWKPVEAEAMSRLKINPDMIDLGFPDFEVDFRVCPIKKAGQIADMQNIVRPSIPEWQAEFEIISSFDKSEATMLMELQNAGENFGIGSGRKIGFGRYKVLSLVKQ